MTAPPTINVIPLDGAVRVCVDGVCHDKPMTPATMRLLAIELLHRAAEAERAEREPSPHHCANCVQLDDRPPPDTPIQRGN